MKKHFLIAISLAALGGLGESAHAELYKYEAKNGTIVFTENLSELPKERQEYYKKMIAERRTKEAEDERIYGKEALKKQADAQKEKQIQDNKAAVQSSEQRLRMLEASTAMSKKARTDRENLALQFKQERQNKVSKLKQMLTDYEQARTKYNTVAIRPTYTLLPGQRESMEQARSQMESLAPQIESLAHEIEVTLPERARKEGIPPGALR